MKAALAVVLALGCGCGSPPPPTPSKTIPANPTQEPFHLVDISSEAGLDRFYQSTGHEDVDYIIDAKGAGGAWLDYDGDGDPDFYLVQGGFKDGGHEGPPDQLLRNDGDPDGDGVPTFTDVAKRAGLGDRLRSYGAAVADYDNDGDPDIYLTNWGPNRLYRNEGDGTFTDVAKPAGVDHGGWGVTAAWGDTDRDGDLDLYVANYVVFEYERYPARGEQPAGDAKPCVWHGMETYCGPRNLEPAADAFFRNDGDPDGDGIPSFTEATREAGLTSGESFYSLSAHFFDADGDGDDDLYVANDSVMNNFFVNRGDGTFQDQSVLSGLGFSEQGHEQGGMGIGTGDYDGDGLLDVAVTNFSHDHDTLYHNEGGNLFADVSYPAGLGKSSYLTTGFAIMFLDLDQDGWEDLLVSHGHVYPQVEQLHDGTTFKQRNGLFRNRGDGTLEDLVDGGGPGMAIVKASRAIFPVDLEGDGDLDLMVTNLSDTPDLLRNDGVVGGWLQVRLEGTTSNRDGIGALIKIETGGRTQIREVRRTAFWEGSSLPIAHFGLGRASSVDRVEVRWPSGRISMVEQVEANRRMELREPDGD